MLSQVNTSSLPLPWNSEKAILCQQDDSLLPLIDNEISTVILPPLQLNSNKPDWLPSIYEILGDQPIISPAFRAWSATFMPSAFEPTSAWKPSGSPKRPRRRFHEIERKFTCNFPSCTKSYGALNHLNAHIANRDHGPRRKAREFVSFDYFNTRHSSQLYKPNTPSSSHKSESPQNHYKPSPSS